MPRRLAFVVVASALIAAAWLELQLDRSPLVDLARIVALALLPALVLLVVRGRWGLPAAAGALGVALFPAASVAFRVSLAEMRPRDPERDFFGPVFSAIGDGFRDFYETAVPFDRLDHAEMEGLVLLAIFAFVAVAGALLAARRPLAAALVILVGVGWPATISATAGGRSLRTGTLTLAALLLLLFLVRADRRPLRGAVQALSLGGVLVAAAVAASTSGAVAKDAFLSWQRWDLYDRPSHPVGVRYVWNSSYRGIQWPEKETVVLQVRAPKRALYWRATTLDEYTGIGWRESLDPGRPLVTSVIDDALADPLLPAAARDEGRWTEQEVVVGPLADAHLIAAAQPVKWESSVELPVQYAPGGVVLLPNGLTRGLRYKVWSYTPIVEPDELLGVRARYPRQLDRYLEVLPGVRVPRFGAPNRHRRVEELLAGPSSGVLLEQYRALYEEARDVVGDPGSAYAAAIGLEAWFRQQGGFTYDEKPPQPVGSEPPLVDFVLRTKRGYCQHFAGAMAVMLRLLGVPARVAAGFVSGDYNESRGEWTVTDRDAHTWVEVYFPGHGWLPFDPTPGRGQLAADYSTASPDFTVQEASSALSQSPEVAAILDRFERQLGPLVDPLAIAAGFGIGDLAAEEGGGGASRALAITGLVLLVFAVAIGSVLSLKALRRRLRFASRDPRRLAAACRRDLVGFLSDQRLAVGRTVTTRELGAQVERRYGIDAGSFVRAADAARFGAPHRSDEAARRARGELRALLRKLRRQLSTLDRVRGAFRLRSLAS